MSLKCNIGIHEAWNIIKYEKIDRTKSKTNWNKDKKTYQQIRNAKY